MSELEEVNVFVTLVECQSASRAAEKMGLANSAISRRMKALEERLGVQLIQRTTRTMHLTDDGQLYYQRCRKLLDDWHEAEQEVMQSAAELSGTLTVSAPLSLGLSHLAPAITDFMQDHPQLKVNLDLSDRRVDLVEDGYDLAFRIGALEDSSLMARLVTEIRHIVYCSPGFLDQYGPFNHPDDLRDAPGLGYSNLRHPGRWPYSGPDGEKGEGRVEPRMLSSNGEALRAASIKGIGIGCQPSFILHDAISAGQLVPVLTEYQWYGMNLYAIYPQTRHLSRRVRALIDYLVEYFQQDKNWNSGLKLFR